MLGIEGCPSYVPAPVLWKLNQVKHFLLLEQAQTTTPCVQSTGPGMSLAEAQRLSTLTLRLQLQLLTYSPLKPS